ncbi:dolichol monophosphate mannose synthase [Legionella qingyii]|uniref:Dolichol monophosphate mannose synthase n=2 Tax=Legionella qingyii TaxID=2184757 RepID=A0A317U6F1_9GAMM|nr:glycosyltransferase family 39 protein [Legionella qingyii]PWY57039.1 dolichol monophosphate mannose synthase [Legionella qingyii]PWY57340.1 dolichol monophosphate mannose synthase [Legionella qingyii]RUR26429.1 glycosyltransferase family 39 protein [Legionella qingyii]RUR27449.1 glycosyltransferase family 39 protein [Legionella qingyii]
MNILPGNGYPSEKQANNGIILWAFLSSRSVYLFLTLYFIILLFLAPINILSLDTYYYWDWSRHLALSYYDGSPMIAYFIRLATLLFGDNLFALSFIGITCIAISSGIIYKSARFFLSPEASCITMLSWLFSPLVTLDILKQTTYDTPLALFWSLTLYYTIKFIQTNRIRDLYLIGISSGLMMLSKYSGIVLILSLLIFLIFSTYRSIFKSRHFYFATILAIIIFSPVIFWNYQNHWQSFIYQLTTHKLNPGVNPFYHAVKTLFTSFIPSLNIMLLPPFLVRNQKLDEKSASVVTLCRTICITFLCFYLYTASQAGIREFWLTPYIISSAILFGYWFTTFNYRKFAILLLILYAIISLCILIDNTSKFNFIKSKKLISYHLIQKFNASHTELPDTVFTSGWFTARMLFFLKNKPIIYTLGCGTAQNQYALWNVDINQKIADKTLKEILYIDRHDRQSCLKQYFDQCQKIPTHVHPFRHKEYALNVYKCRNF